METDRSTRRRKLARRWLFERELGELGIRTLTDLLHYLFGPTAKLPGDLAELRLPLFLELELRKGGIATITEAQAAGEAFARTLIWYDVPDWIKDSGQKTVDLMDFALIGRGLEPLS